MSRVQRLGSKLFRKPIVRYLFGIAAIAMAFGLRIWLVPLTGTGAPFVFFFGAVLATSLFAGVGPGILVVLLGASLRTAFAVQAGHTLFQALFHSLLFAIDGIVVIYLTVLMKRERQTAQEANRQLRIANEELTSSAGRTRELI